MQAWSGRFRKLFTSDFFETFAVSKGRAFFQKSAAKPKIQNFDFRETAHFWIFASASLLGLLRPAGSRSVGDSRKVGVTGFGQNGHRLFLATGRFSIAAIFAKSFLSRISPLAIFHGPCFWRNLPLVLGGDSPCRHPRLISPTHCSVSLRR